MSDPELDRVVADWLRFATGDLSSAEAMLRDRVAFDPRHACYAAQQAAEKSLKAVCVARQIAFPFSHDLEELVGLLDADDESVRASHELAWLSQWAVNPRYPGTREPDWADAERACGEGRAVVEAATRDVEAGR
ncbi:MAG: HEPN domain-containing protein [Solirubrobacteraceae bacterium]